MLTPEAFLAFYPQFSSFAQGVVLPEYLRQANARFSDFGEDADEARRLYTAHKLTLYSASCLPEGVTTPTKSQIASAGKGSMQEIASKKLRGIFREWLPIKLSLLSMLNSYTIRL